MVQIDDNLTMAGDHHDGPRCGRRHGLRLGGLRRVRALRRELYVYAYIQDGLIEPESADPGAGLTPIRVLVRRSIPTLDQTPTSSSLILPRLVPAGREPSTTLNVPGGFFGTNIPLNIFIPEGAGPFPVVVMTDGFNLAGDLYTSYGDHLASWGFIVVFADIPNNFIFPKTPPELIDYLGATFDFVEAEAMGQLGERMSEARRRRTLRWSRGCRSSPSMMRVRLASSPSIRWMARWYRQRQPRGLPLGRAELMDLLEVPAVLLGETTNGDAERDVDALCASRRDFQQYYLGATGPALEIEMVGANYTSFLDNPNCGLDCSVCPSGTDDPTTTRILTQSYRRPSSTSS